MTQQDRQFDDFTVGDTVCFTRTFTLDDFEAFARLSGDCSPLHCDAAYSARTRFGRPIVPLALATAPFSAVAGMMLPGHRSLELDTRVRALRPVPYDAPIEYSAQVIARHEMGKVLVLRILAFHDRDVLIDARLQVQVRDEPEPGAWTDDAEPPIRNCRRERVALVTGATGAIGRAICLLLAQRGWKIIAHARDRQRAEELARQCSRHGDAPLLLLGDLCCTHDRRRMIESISNSPPIGDLVHAASPPIDDGHSALIEGNYAALRELSEALLPNMLRRQCGTVLLVGTSAVDHAPVGWDDYVAAKQAAASYVRALDRRYSPYGIRGVTLSPGWVLSGFSATWRPRDAACLLPEEVAENIADELERDIGAGASHEVEDHSVGNGLRAVPRGAGRRRTAVHPTARSPFPTDPKRETNHRDTSGADVALDDLIRDFFALPPDMDLDDAGLDRTPGWDSLGHLQLLLALESALQIRFTSQELSHTTRLADLRRLADAKLAHA